MATYTKQLSVQFGPGKTGLAASVAYTVYAGASATPVIARTVGTLTEKLAHDGSGTGTYAGTDATFDYAWLTGRIDYEITGVANILNTEDFQAPAQLDTTGRVLLQPAQAGVTIPTVTNLTNGVSVTGNVLVDAASLLAALATIGLNSAAVAKLSKLDLITGAGGITVISALVSGGLITIQRGDKALILISGLGLIPASRSKLWFTLKHRYADTDAQAVAQVTEAGGLIILNGVPYLTTTDGSVTVTDATAGNLTIVLKAAATALLVPASGYVYDIQYLDSDGSIKTLTKAKFTVEGDVTRAVS